MTLATILALYFLGLGLPTPQASPPPQAPPDQTSSTPTQPAPDSGNQPKPVAKTHHRKKPTEQDCTTTTSAPDSADNSAPSSPCPPPKKVVRNGGSPEPTVQLTGGTPAEQAVHQSSTNQLTAATEENLKKIAGRQLSSSQQEMVTQIKQFMAQSKAAVAAGDLERGHNLAMKAQLLSEELVKP